MLGWCIVILAGARLKVSVRFPPFRGMCQKEARTRDATHNVNVLRTCLELFTYHS